MHFGFQLGIPINYAQDWNSGASLLFQILDYRRRVIKFWGLLGQSRFCRCFNITMNEGIKAVPLIKQSG